MSILDKLLPEFTRDERAERNRLLGLMCMFFLVVTAVGILKPVKNSLALSGLADREFYKVYAVSAVVVLFVPLYNRLSDRIGWKALVPAVAVFFAFNLVLFRLAYAEGSTTLGLMFYGWYDLFAAALVTQFFVATQMFLNARSARSAYPLVIGGGAIGAMLGGGISALLADRIGTPNLLLVAALFILAFAGGITFFWPDDEIGARLQRPGRRRRPRTSLEELRHVFANSHVRLIAVSVVLTILVKQLVDYQFNTLTEQIFVTEDAITEFQGKVNLFTQGLPLLSVMALRPLLRRWGIGLAIFLLPTLMLVTGLGMAVLFSIWTVIAVRTADTTFRYSSERAGREILYVPVPDDIKLKAKTYIDVGIEKGAGKAISAAFVFLLVEPLGFTLHQMAYVVLALVVAWLTVTVAMRKEYVRTLARSIRGRFASFEGLSTLSDASTQKVVQQALEGRDPVQTSFALDLVDQSAGTDTGPVASALHDLLDHDVAEIRLKALQILAKDPDSVIPERVHPRLDDPVRSVREHAVLALAAASSREHREALVRELLTSDHVQIRTATLACLARGDIGLEGAELLGDDFLDELLERADRGDRDARIELALAAGALRQDPRAPELVAPLLGDPDPVVASAAIRSAGMLRRPELTAALIAGLRAPGTREAAREALSDQGPAAIETLSGYLLDEAAHPFIRRQIPSVLARMADQRSVDVMLRSVIAPETDQLLDYRALKALSQLRVRAPDLEFERGLVRRSIRREVRAAERYDRARRCLRRTGPAGPAAALLLRSLDEAWAERREGVFRLVGLLHPPEEVYRCFLAVSGGERSARANAIEWLEETVDRSLFEVLGPVLGEIRAEPARASAESAIAPLLDDGDLWIARVAAVTAAEIDETWCMDALRGIIDAGTNPELAALAERLLDPSHEPAPRPRMDLIEKVFLLQKIDLLQDARTSHLALLASIAEEVEVDAGTELIRHDEPTDALYVVIEGEVGLEGVANQSLQAGEGRAFGTWALIDEAPSLVTATTRTPSRLLRITRTDFYDLLADHSELALGLLQGLARRVRTLVA